MTYYGKLKSLSISYRLQKRAYPWKACFEKPSYQFHTKNWEEKNFLFTRVDLKNKSGSSAYLLESKASLYAQRNFTIYLSGKIAWKSDFLKKEQQFTKALFWQVASGSAVLKGLTLIQKFSQNGVVSFIYAVDLPNFTVTLPKQASNPSP